MNQFSAEKFHSLGQMLQTFAIVLEEFGTDGKEIGDKGRTMIRGHLDSAEARCRAIGLIQSAKMCQRISKATGIGTCQSLQFALRQLNDLVPSEMEEQLFLWIPTQRADFYNRDAFCILGQICCDRFPIIVPEIEEAMKCYACGRYTGSAFHLMRATEAGTKALGDAIGAKMRNNNWGDVFKEFDRQAALSPVSRPTHWQTHGDFLEDIGGNLRAVKTTWRNRTAHLDQSYGEEQIAKLIVIVPEFMRHLSEKLDENGKLY